MPLRQKLLFTATFCAAAMAAAAADARMRGDISVDNPQITLGDLFDDAGDRAKEAVTPAPLPGKQIALRTSYLSALARRYGMDSSREPDRKFIVVTRGSDLVPTQVIGERIALAAEAAGARGPFDVQISSGPVKLHVAKGLGKDTKVEILDFQYQQKDGRFEAVVEAPAGAKDAQRIKLFGRIDPVSTVPVVNRTIARGEVISASDLDWIEQSSRDLRRGVILDDDSLIGAEATRNLRAGKPVRIKDVQAPILVRKGSLVTMSLQSAGMTLTATGRALKKGAMDDVIPVLSARSRRTVQAQIIARDVVRVHIRRLDVTALSN